MADYDNDKPTSHYADESFSKHYNPGMIEAKIMMPYKTSTPMKPIFFKSDDSSFAETGVEDSGYLSTLTENTSARKSDSSDCKDGCKNLSLFESMLQSRNHSINLEQLVEKVNLRKEKKNEMLYNVSTAGRPRSYSASEVSSVISGPRRVRLSEDSSNSSLSSWSNVSSSSLLSESGSPTLDQVLLMGRADKLRRFPRVGISPQLSRSSSDYDISDMLAAIKMKEGPLQSPQTSPDASSYIRNPESLFGLETLQRCLYQPRKESCKPGLASISEAECDGSLSTTPREYYSSGLSPGMTTFPLTPQLDSPEQVLVCQSSSVTWSGNIPQRQHQHPRYSAKIFLGGVPWDVTEISLVQAFSQFGQIRIEWPGKDSSPSPPKGYVYIVFDDEEHVPHLLAQCSHSNTAWYFKISSRRMRSKEVQIIPWVLADSNYVRCPSQRLDPQKTVFVGALHGMLNAEGLAHIFNDLFGGVVYAGIDTDKHKYPIGSGRVTFSSSRSYMKAVAASFVEIKCPQFNKRVQVDPYLEDALCSSCLLKQGPYFCRDLNCFKYFCRHCWEAAHGGEWRHHKPLMRNTRTGGGPATRPTISLTPPRV